MDELAEEIAARRRRIAQLREELAREETQLAGFEAFAAKVRGNELAPAPDAEASVPAQTAAALSEEQPARKRRKPKREYRRNPPLRERLSESTVTTSIEVLLLKALIEHFPSGSTVNQLAEFISERWGRIAKQQSYSVALTGLQHRGEVYSRNRLWYPVIKEDDPL